MFWISDKIRNAKVELITLLTHVFRNIPTLKFNGDTKAGTAVSTVWGIEKLNFFVRGSVQVRPSYFR